MFLAGGHGEGMNLSGYHMIQEDSYIYLFLAAEWMWMRMCCANWQNVKDCEVSVT